MAGVMDCMDEALAAGRLSQDSYDQFKQVFEEFVEDNLKDMPQGAAEAKAKDQVLDRLGAEALHKKRKSLLAIQRKQALLKNLAEFTNARGEHDMAEGLMWILEHHGQAKYTSVEGRRKAVNGLAHAKLEQLLYEMRPDAIGNPKAPARLENISRELFGEDTGDVAAKELAQAWGEVAEYLRKRYNAAGGAIGKLEGWGMPQTHNAQALINAGKEKWKAHIAPMLDREKMRHHLTGEKLSDGELERSLDHVYETIVKDGWNTREPAMQRVGRGALSNQKMDHRFLMFKDADSWLSYQKDFGEGNPYATMMGHLNVMSRDIAALEVLGPNPDGMLEFLKQVVQKENTALLAGEANVSLPKTGRTTDSKLSEIDNMWLHMRGTANTPIDAKIPLTNLRVASSFAAARNVQTASKLGSALLSAMSDTAITAMSRKFVGLPVAKQMGDLFKAMGSFTQRQAVASGLILDSAMNVASQQARYAGSISGNQFTARVADGVMRVTGLSWWTQAGRHAFGLAFTEALGSRSNLAFNELPGAFARTLDRWGFTPDDWDLMRSQKLYERDGVKFMRPTDLADAVKNFDADGAYKSTRVEQLGEKLLEMIQGETEYAVPSGSVRARAFLVGGNRSGTMWGEIRRNFAQFKGFGTVMIMLHAGRALREIQGGNLARGAGYAGGLLIGTTLIAGTVTMPLRDIVKGKEPRDPFGDEGLAYWKAATMQGGGFGIYGDFFFAEQNRYGGGFARTLAGPLTGEMTSALNLTLGNVTQFLSDEEMNLGSETIKMMKSNTPGGSIWYARLAWERNVLDQLQWLIDPEAQSAFKRKVRRAKKQYNQDYFSKPGDSFF